MANNNNSASSIIPVQSTLNPFTPDDKDMLQKIITDAKQHLDLIAKAEECGLEMSEQKARAEMHASVAQKMLEKFFPTSVFPTDMQ